jgi:hypothetical protein
MTAIQVRKLLGDIAALQKRLRTRAGVIFRGPFEAGAEPADASLAEHQNAACVITTIYEAPPDAERKPVPNLAGPSRKKRRR